MDKTFRTIRVIILYISLLFSSSDSQQQQQQQQQLLQQTSSSRAKTKLFNIVENDRILLLGGINAMIGM
jgi:preprotein translocase subunit YajC